MGSRGVKRTEVTHKLNRALINAKAKEKGLPVITVLRDAGISTGCYNNYCTGKYQPNDLAVTRISRLLGIPKDKLLISVSDEAGVTDDILKPISATDEEIKPEGSTLILKNLDTLNVTESFATINQNILAIGQFVVGQANIAHGRQSYICDRFETLINQMGELGRRIDILEQRLSESQSQVDTAPVVQESVEFVTDEVYEEFTKEELIHGYDQTDSYEKWRNKMIAMATLAGKNSKLTVKQVLKNVYSRATTVYGIVWDQERKDYISIYHEKPMSNLELSYSNELVRNITYCILVDMMCN